MTAASRSNLPALTGVRGLAALWVLVFMMTREFGRHSRLAAMMQYPYLAWLTFAASARPGPWFSLIVRACRRQ